MLIPTEFTLGHAYIMLATKFTEWLYKADRAAELCLAMHKTLIDWDIGCSAYIWQNGRGSLPMTDNELQVFCRCMETLTRQRVVCDKYYAYSDSKLHMLKIVCRKV